MTTKTQTEGQDGTIQPMIWLGGALIIVVAVAYFAI